MNRKRLLVLKLLAIFVGRISAQCDMATTAVVEEGNLGQTSDFNWLGVLRVHIHDEETVQVAVTGIVLIKIKYALANADDIVRIPKHIFLTDSQAMFLGVEDTPWYCQPISYVTHPEYEYYTFNSIAVVELNVDDAMNYPVNPICFPTESMNTSNHLYLAGYTDENQLLEKVIYKIQYIAKEACEEFYNRAGLSAKNRVPASYICGFSEFNKTHCVWDNGMALVSNVTGFFTLIGFGIRGPGCAAPARFIDLSTYTPWLRSVTTQQQAELYDSPDYRRLDGDVEYIPTHDLYRPAESRKHISNDSVLVDKIYLEYPFDVKKLKNFEIVPHDEHSIAIFPFDEKLEMHSGACENFKQLMYAEIFELTGPENNRGVVVYKLSMYDLLYKWCVCVLLTVESEDRSEAVLSFREEFEYSLGTQLTESSETPEELFRYYPIYPSKAGERTTELPKNTTPKFEINNWYKPTYIKSDVHSANVQNYDLYIRFEFYRTAKLKFELFARPDAPTRLLNDSSFFSSRRSKYDEKNSRMGKKKKPRLGKKKKKHQWGIRVNGKDNKRVRQPLVAVAADTPTVLQETCSRSVRPHHTHHTHPLLLITFLCYIFLR